MGRTALLEFKDPSGQTVLDGSYLKQVQLGTDRYGQITIDWSLIGGRTAFCPTHNPPSGQATTIVLDGEVLQTVMIREPILEGRAQITGGMTVKRLAIWLCCCRKVLCRYPCRLAEIRNVGPTLGQDSIDLSFLSGHRRCSLDLALMGLYYKLPGVVADLALLVYIVILLGVLSAIDAVHAAGHCWDCTVRGYGGGCQCTHF